MDNDLKIGDIKTFKLNSIINYDGPIEREISVQVILNNAELWNVLITDQIKEYYVGILIEKLMDDYYKLQRCRYWCYMFGRIMQCSHDMKYCNGLNFECQGYTKKK